MEKKYKNISRDYRDAGFEENEIVTLETYKSLNCDGDPDENFFIRDGQIIERYWDGQEVVIAVEVQDGN